MCVTFTAKFLSVWMINYHNGLINLQILGDKDEKVKYNATKAMISLGNWSLPAMAIIVRCIKDGDYEMQKDLVKTMINARNVHLVNKVGYCDYIMRWTGMIIFNIKKKILFCSVFC